jgi:hypothetical protein
MKKLFRPIPECFIELEVLNSIKVFEFNTCQVEGCTEKCWTTSKPFCAKHSCFIVFCQKECLPQCEVMIYLL